MKRVLLGMTALVGMAVAVGAGCKKETTDEPDLAKPADMVGSGQDLSAGADMAVTVDMAMRTPGTGQIIIADVSGTVYQPAAVDGGVAAVPGAHVLAAIAQFPQFEPAIGANDENTLNLTAFPPSGCTVQTFVPLAGDLPESQVMAGTVVMSPIAGGIIGVSATTPAGAPLPSNGTQVACQHTTAPGFGVYACGFNALDADMGMPWNGQLATSTVFPTFPDTMFAGNCPSTNYIHFGGFCIPNPLGASVNLLTTGMGSYAATPSANIAVTAPPSVTISGITVGGTAVPSGTSLDALEGHFDSDGALEVSFACDTTCAASGAGELPIVGLLAQTSKAPRGMAPAATDPFAVAQCIASTDTGKVTMSASQVAKLRAAAAGGSIQFTLARLNVRIDAGTSTSQTVIRGAGRGSFAFINQP